jgi:hypothetical protein
METPEYGAECLPLRQETKSTSMFPGRHYAISGGDESPKQFPVVEVEGTPAAMAAIRIVHN